MSYSTITKLISIVIFSFLPIWIQAQKTYLFAVGVSDYQSINDLEYCDSDAKVFLEVYKKNDPLISSMLLLNKAATRKKILEGVKQLFANAKETDRVIFYFSGHGSEGFFCPYDASRNNLISYKDLRKIFSVCKAKNQFLFADACHSGSVRVASEKTSEDSLKLKEKHLMFFLSSRTNQKAIEATKLKGGVFTHFLIRGIKGGADINRDRCVTAREIFDFVSSNVKQQMGKQQTPVMWGNFPNEMNIIDWRK